MSLRTEIVPYIDGNGLVSCEPSLGRQRSCDNNVMFTSEYYLYLKLNNELHEKDYADYRTLLSTCELEPGLFSRAPGDRGIQPPDDYLAIMSCCAQLGLPEIASRSLRYGLKNLGSFNNESPGKWSLKSFLWRQPQLIAATFSATGEGQFNPLVKTLNAYAALCILVANRNDPKEEVDGRRLTFLLIKAMEKTSVLSRMAAIVWENRMIKTYGEDFMKEICKIYYKGDGKDYHPFGKYGKY